MRVTARQQRALASDLHLETRWGDDKATRLIGSVASAVDRVCSAYSAAWRKPMIQKFPLIKRQFCLQSIWLMSWLKAMGVAMKPLRRPLFGVIGLVYVCGYVYGVNAVALSLDKGFNAEITGVNAEIRDLAYNPVNQTVVVAGRFDKVRGNAFARHLTAFSLNGDFRPFGFFTNAPVNALAIDTAGYLYAAGEFTASKRLMVRAKPDGALDPSFELPTTLLDTISTITHVALQQDKILIVANRRTDGLSTVKRLNSNGTIDASFQLILNPGNVSAFKILSNNKLLIAHFSSGASTVKYIKQYLPDGSADPSFGDANGWAEGFSTTEKTTALAIQPDGKIIFNKVDLGYHYPNVPSSVGRLLTDGRIDPSFPVINSGGDATDPDVPATGEIFDLEVSPSALLAIAGDYSSLDGLSKFNLGLKKLSALSTLSFSFQPGRLTSDDATVTKTLFLPDGRMVVGKRSNPSSLDSVLEMVSPINTPPRFAGVEDGRAMGTNGTVHTLFEDKRGGLIVGGVFTQVYSVKGGTTFSSNKRNIARFLPDGQIDPDFGRVNLF